MAWLCPKRCYSKLKFVPKHGRCQQQAVDQLQEFVDGCQNLFVLTGAGISTESGIPDYRSEGVGLYATSRNRPVQYQDFVKNPKVRQRYWARNYVGWSKFSAVQPNITHKVLVDWERKGKIKCLVTQNVDRLHRKAGSQLQIELHGSAHEVVCLSCPSRISRSLFQDRLQSMNAHLDFVHSPTIRPDGDVELSQDQVESFVVPLCINCGGDLKPDIVFFGDNVPKSRVESLKGDLTTCDGVLALGTSLSVYSSYRFILLAKDLNFPIGLVNIGSTRGDSHAQFRISARCGEILPRINV